MTEPGTVELYVEPDGTTVVKAEFQAIMQGTDRELKNEVVWLVKRLEGLANGKLRPVDDRYDSTNSRKPWLYWRPVGRLGALYHVTSEQEGLSGVLVLRLAEASSAWPVDADIKLARKRLKSP